MYSEKATKFWEIFPLLLYFVATKFWEIFPLLLSFVVPVKIKENILQNYVAFSEYMNLTKGQIKL